MPRIPQPYSFWPLAALACLALSPTVRAEAVPPTMTNDPVAYLHILETSTDPAAAAVRAQIESGPADLARAREAAAKEGIPLDPDALQKPLPPEGENAAPVYQKLFRLLRRKPLDLPQYADPLGTTYAYTPAQLTDVRKTLAARPDVMSLVHQAADRPQCVFARDWKLGSALLLPEFQPIRGVARLLNTESYLLAAQGKYAEAVKNQARGFRVAEHAGSDPIFISFLVGVACDAIALRGMQNVLTLAGPNADVSAQVAKAVSENRPRLSLRYALGGEAASETVTYQDLRRGVTIGGVSTLLPWMGALFGRNGFSNNHSLTTDADTRFALDWLDASEAQALNGMRTLVAASDLEPLARRSAFAQEFRRRAAQPRNVLALNRMMPSPGFDRMDQNDTRRLAGEAVTLAAADVLGGWTKGAPVPAVLPHAMTDPFTGRALGYRPDGSGGFVVYSVGPDGAFDGGKPGDARNDRQIKFRYPAAATPVPPDMLK